MDPGNPEVGHPFREAASARPAEVLVASPEEVRVEVRVEGRVEEVGLPNLVAADSYHRSSEFSLYGSRNDSANRASAGR